MQMGNPTIGMAQGKTLRMVGIDVFHGLSSVTRWAWGLGQRIGEMHMPLERLVPKH
jgi:hypothetical protein